MQEMCSKHSCLVSFQLGTGWHKHDDNVKPSAKPESANNHTDIVLFYLSDVLDSR